MVFSPFYKELYLNSLLPFERLEKTKKGNKLLGKCNQKYYLEFWKNSVCTNASEESFNEYCNTNNLTTEEMSLMTSQRIIYNGKIDYPLWVKALSKILNNVQHDKTRNENHSYEIPFYELLFPFVSFFTSEFKNSLKNVGISIPNQDIIHQVESALYKELNTVSTSVFLEEFSKYKQKNKIDNQKKENYYYKKFVSGIIKDKFHSLFLKYPMLGRKLANKTQKYIGFIADIFKRYDTDKREIASSLDKEVLKLKKIHLSCGDQHNGASTTILEFENTLKIVYKPINLTITTAYNNFLDWINIKLQVGLKSFNILDKKEYGWIMFIENSECSSIDEIKKYYEKAGIIAGITYFLNSRDYHFENVIASGNTPVLIDHETIVGPDLKFQNLSNYMGTVLGSLLFSYPDKIEPNCGFGSSAKRTNQIQGIKIADCNKDTMRKVPQISHKKTHTNNIPMLQNKPQHMINYQKEFQKGFQKLYYLIIANKELLLTKDSPLEHFKNKKIRQIVRPTRVYGKILRLLNKPEFLKDPVKYGLKLELLARAFKDGINTFPLLEFERKQMCMDDIPVFYLDTESNYLHLSKTKKANILERSAIDSIKNKIRNASLNDYKYQMNLIEQVITL